MSISSHLRKSVFVCLLFILILPTAYGQAFDPITDLIVEVGDDVWTVNEVQLSWTSPTQGGTGTATGYIIKYGLTDVWEDMTAISNLSVPLAGGELESIYIDNLTIGSVYHFAVKSLNGTGEESLVSNYAIGTPASNGNFTSTINFFNSSWIEINHLSLDEPLFIQIVNADNADLNEIEVVMSYGEPVSVDITTLIETNINSGVYRGLVNIDPDNTIENDGIISPLPGDFITTTYTDPTDEWGNPADFSNEIPYGGTALVGEISGTWIASESPYFIFGDLNTNGQALTIDAGVSIIFLGHYSATIGGILNINGTEENPVKISSTEGRFNGFDLHAASSIDWCSIENSDGGFNAYYEIDVSHSVFSNNGYALQLRGVSATVDSCEFLGNTQAGLLAYNLACSYTISNSIFRDNNMGFFGDNTSHVTISNCVFVNNTSVGLSLDDVDINIINSLIAYNDNNGINVGYPSYPDFNFSMSNSAIYDNQIYDISHSSSNNLVAQNNWWGYLTTSQMYNGDNPQNIEAIYDFNDDANVGLVNYSNWLPAPDGNIAGTPASVVSIELFTDSTFTTVAPGWISSGERVYIQASGVDQNPLFSSVTSVLATTGTTSTSGHHIALLESDPASGLWRGSIGIENASSYASGTIGGLPGETLTVQWIADNQISASLLIAEPTPPPDNLTASTGLSDYIQLAWVAPSSSLTRETSSISQLSDEGPRAIDLRDNSLREIIGYNVYRGLSEDGPFSLIEENTTLLAYADHAVEVANSYHYFVTAVYQNPETESSSSNMTEGMRGNIPAVTELQYDDGSVESAYTWNSISGNGVRFTTGDAYSQITSISVFIAWPEDPTIPFEMRIYDAGQNMIRSGIIGQASGPNEWVTIDLSQENIVTPGTEFYVAMFYPNAGGPWLGSDQSSAYERSYSVWCGWNFVEALGENYMIRAAYTPIASPHSLHVQSDRDSEVYLTWMSPHLPQIPNVDSDEPAQPASEIMEQPQSLRSEFQSFNIYRSQLPSGPYTMLAQNVYGNHFLDTGLTNEQTYYYVVTASYTGPDYESAYSNEASGTPTGLLSPVLFVDDDNWWGWVGGWGLHQPFENALINAQIPYDYYATSVEGPPLSLMEDYSMIFWTTSLAGPMNSHLTLTENDQLNLASFLDGGGRLLLAGMDIANQLNGTSFLSDYLGVSFVQDDSEIDIVDGIQNDPISDQTIITFRATTQHTPDVISTLDNYSTSVFTYEGSEYSGGQRKLTSTYATILFPWDFSTITSDPMMVSTLMRNAWEWLAPISGPSANFSTNVVVGDPPLIVNYSDLSEAGDTLITTWLWEFGDGVTSSDQNPTHEYVSAGLYSPRLTVTDGNGLFDIEEKFNFINVGALNPPENLSAEVVANDVVLSWESPGTLQQRGRIIHGKRSGEISPHFSEISISHGPNPQQISTREIRELSGYKIYRDNTLLLEVPIGTLSYTDLDLTPATYHYHVTATYEEGESGPTNEVVVTVLDAPVLFTDSFESYTDFDLAFSPWTLVDVDQSSTYAFTNASWLHSGDAQAFIIFNQASTTPPTSGADAHSGAKSSVCFASTSPPNNDWMMSPRMELGSESRLSFWAKSHTDAYGLERFKVGISTSGTNPSDFSIISAGTFVETPTNWTQFIYDLSAYDGEQIFIGIQCLSHDAFVFYVDDFVVHSYGGIVNPPFSDPPQNLSATVNQNDVTLNWEAPGTFHSRDQINQKSDRISSETQGKTLLSVRPDRSDFTMRENRELAGYRIYRDGAVLVELPVGSLTHTDLDLAPATYSYHVIAIYDEGESSASNEVVVTVLDAPALFTDDFESYPDFDLAFSPWTLVDVDQSGTYLINGYTWPHATEAQAFIIFNQLSTTPPATGIDAHSGAKAAACFASTSPPNNDWMMTPRMEMGTESRITFWARSHTDAYGLERFKVGVSTTGTNPSDFTIISAGTYVESPTTWTQYTYDLGAYDGDQIYIGLQCLSHDAFVFYVDDFAIHSYGGTVNPITLNPPQALSAEVMENDVVLSWEPPEALQRGEQQIHEKSDGRVVTNISEVSPFEGDTGSLSTREIRELSGYKIYRDASLVVELPLGTLSYTDLDLPPSTYSYHVTAIYEEGESELSNQVDVSVLDAPALFIDDFESYADFDLDFSPWTLVDVDQSGTYLINGYTWPHATEAQAFIIFNQLSTTPAATGIDAHSGAKAAACFASTSPPNNDWMMTPRVELGTESRITFWARSHTDAYGLERFKVGVSTTGTNPSDFTIISAGTYVESPITWTQYTYDLGAYDGDQIFIGILCLSHDAFVFYVDDFAVHSFGGMINEPPMATDDTYNTLEDESLIINAETGLMENDSDPNDDALTTQIQQNVTHGTLSPESDGSFTYVPDENYHGDDSFTYKAFDGAELSNEATVNLTITSVNDPPTAFTLEAPSNEMETTIDYANLEDSLQFSWSASTDVDGDDISYQFVFSEGLTGIEIPLLNEPHFALGYQTIADAIGEPGIVSVTWQVMALDVLDSTWSDNGPFSLTLNSSPLSTHLNQIPSDYVLEQNYPNPFNPSTTIRYGLPEDAIVSLRIYDLRGNVVQTLESGRKAAGWYELVWNGETANGLTISTGIYFARIVAADYTQVVKMLYLK